MTPADDCGEPAACTAPHIKRAAGAADKPATGLPGRAGPGLPPPPDRGGRRAPSTGRPTSVRRRPAWLYAPGPVYAGRPVRTYSPKASEIHRVWYEVDADGAVLGRLAAEVARVLRGKHKAMFAPHIDTGDHVIVVNAAKVVLTAGKADKKFHYRHSGYPGGIRAAPTATCSPSEPEEVVRITVKGMLPKGPLGRQMLQ